MGALIKYNTALICLYFLASLALTQGAASGCRARLGQQHQQDHQNSQLID